MSVYTKELADMLAKYGVNVPQDQIIQPVEKQLEQALEKAANAGKEMLQKAIDTEKMQKLTELVGKYPQRATTFLDSQSGIELINLVIDDVITYLEN